MTASSLLSSLSSHLPRVVLRLYNLLDGASSLIRSWISGKCPLRVRSFLSLPYRGNHSLMPFTTHVDAHTCMCRYAPFAGHGDISTIRLAQADDLPHIGLDTTGMAVTIDLGDPAAPAGDVHSRKKEEVA